MEKPLDYGGKTDKKSVIVNHTQKHKKSISSFEIEEDGAGFKFTYPLIKDDNYLGIISITFNDQAITSSLMKQYHILSNFILLEKSFSKEYLKSTSIYIPARQKGFLHNKEILKELKSESRKELASLKPSDEISKLLYKQGMRNNAKSLFVDKLNIIVTTIPIIHNISNKREGFIAILSKGKTIDILNNNYFTILFLFIFLYLTILLLFLQQKIKTLKDKETMQKMMQKDQQLLEQAKMAQMGEMIGNIAHQWRQPLSAISTVASGIKLNYEFKLLKNEDIPEYMDIIVRNTKYLSETIDTFRDYIKDDKEKKLVLIQDVIEESLKIVQASIENHHITIQKDIESNNPIRIYMIKEELSQVIINILNNARDVITHKEIKEGWIKISLKEFKNVIILSIEDNGKGIAKKNISKVFDPYFTTKHQFQGTGLGLYMSKTIVEKHLNGKLEVNNTENGALFKITLPIAEES